MTEDNAWTIGYEVGLRVTDLGSTDEILNTGIKYCKRRFEWEGKDEDLKKRLSGIITEYKPYFIDGLKEGLMASNPGIEFLDEPKALLTSSSIDNMGEQLMSEAKEEIERYIKEYDKKLNNHMDRKEKEIGRMLTTEERNNEQRKFYENQGKEDYELGLGDGWIFTFSFGSPDLTKKERLARLELLKKMLKEEENKFENYKAMGIVPLKEEYPYSSHLEYIEILSNNIPKTVTKEESPSPFSISSEIEILEQKPIRGFAAARKARLQKIASMLHTPSDYLNRLKEIRSLKVDKIVKTDQEVISIKGDKYTYKDNGEGYVEGPTSTFTHDKQKYSVDKAIATVATKRTIQLAVKDLVWIFKYVEPSPERTRIADPSVPVLVTKWRGKLVVVDGLHRLQKAQEQGLETIPAKLLSAKDLQKAKLSVNDLQNF